MSESWNRGILSNLELHTVQGRVLYWLMVGALLLLAVTVVIPFIYSFTTGLRAATQIYSGLQLLPDVPQWQNYERAFRRYDMLGAFGNTIVIVVGGLISQIGVSTLAAYSLSRLKPRGGKIILAGFLATLMIPSVAYFVPLYITVADLGLIGSYWGLWLPYGVNAFMILVLKNFFDALPGELFDAAKVDGASALQIFARIALPLTRPILLVLAILTFVGLWKDFLWPLLVLLNVPERQPIIVKLYQINRMSLPPLNEQMAGYFIAMLPPLFIAIVLQRYMQRGLSLGAVKG